MNSFLCRFLVASSALLACGSFSVAGPITDKALESAIRAVLHEPTAELTDEKLLKLFILEAPGKGIKDLAGLEKCKNLSLLRITNNQVADLKPIKDLVNLQSLDVASNKVADISAIKGLVKLQYLEISGNQIADINAVSQLTAL
ncbi:MAG: leucine-rich repeat domain-containing protein, partial [Planctomycetia bacterium]